MSISDNETITRNLYGTGLIHPLRRLGGNDFVSQSGVPLIRSALTQILGTRIGELAWRPDFGINLEVFRHQNTSEAMVGRLLKELQAVIATWEPRIRVVTAEILVEDNIIRVSIKWNLVTSKSIVGNSVLAGPIITEFEV